MPANDMSFTIYKTKATKKSLTLILSEGEDVIKCIEQAMRENNIDICEVSDLDGVFKDGTITYFIGNNFRTKRIAGKSAYQTHGRYEIKKGQFTGNMHIVLKEGASALTATPSVLVASEDFKVLLHFHEVEELNPRTGEQFDIEKGV